MKNSSDTIGNRTRDLPACSEVPQPNAPPSTLTLCTTTLNIEMFCVLPTMHLCVLLELQKKQHKLIGFYNRDEKCLQRGTDWVFK
jgi:hypothetical protein